MDTLNLIAKLLLGLVLVTGAGAGYMHAVAYLIGAIVR